MKKVMMVVYNYSRDARPRRQSEALLREGYQIDMICLRDYEKGEIKNEKVHGVNVYRLNLSKSRESRYMYLYLYVNFFIRAILKLSVLYLKERYEIVHIHNMPDFLVFTALLPKLMGSKIILDLHDPSPEVYETKFGLSRKHSFIMFILWQERISIRFADKLITTNIAFLKRFISRGCPENKISIIMNSPQESIFLKLSDKTNNEPEKNKLIIMYHGLVARRNGLDTAIEAIAILKDRIPQIEFRIFGRGKFIEYALTHAFKLNLDGYIKYYGSIPIEEIAKKITEIDMGIIPNKATPFTQINFPVRIFEYLCLRKPVIVPRTEGITDYFDEDSILYFEPDNAADLANVIFKAQSDTENTQKILNRGFEIYWAHRWELQAKELISIYNDIGV